MKANYKVLFSLLIFINVRKQGRNQRFPFTLFM